MSEVQRWSIVSPNTWRRELQFGLENRQRTINTEVWNLLDLTPPGTILDICTGTFGSSYNALSSGFDFVGIDIASEMLTHHTQPGKLVQADAAGLPFQDGTFRGVTMIMAVNNIMGNTSVSREIARVLEPNGKIAVCDCGPNTKGINCILWGLKFEKEISQTHHDETTKEYFELNDIPPQKYSEIVLNLMFNMNITQFEQLVRDIHVQTKEDYQKRNITSETRFYFKVLTRIYSELTKAYFDHIEQSLTQQDLIPIRKGGLVTYKDTEGIWHTSEVVEIPPYVNLRSIYERMEDGGIVGIPSRKSLRQPIVKYLPVGIYMKPDKRL